ncbi:hypothetical protein [Pseudomonas sp.]|uniref:hypothetical protein n=1 Tax=Pseudomonas sp. TaxID=306 RepID=UPI003FD8BC31
MDKHRNADGTYNAIGALAAIVGANYADIGELADQVKANHAKLNACAYHEFEPLITAPPGRARYGCKHCRGTIDHHAYYWHELGRRAAP